MTGEAETAADLPDGPLERTEHTYSSPATTVTDAFVSGDTTVLLIGFNVGATQET